MIIVAKNMFRIPTIPCQRNHHGERDGSDVSADTTRRLSSEGERGKRVLAGCIKFHTIHRFLLPSPIPANPPL